MAIGETSGIEKPAKAGAKISEKYLIAKFGADDDTMVPAASATDKLIGVLQVAAEAGQKTRVMLTGVTPLKLGEAVNRGDLITSDADGKGKPTTTAKNIVVGIACASGAADEIIPVLLSQSCL